MSKRSKACDITPKVRKQVMERDKCCVNCGRHHTLTIAHVWANRSHGGLGVVENLCVLCMKCHHNFDNSFGNRHEIVKFNVEHYMERIYGKPNIDKITFRKWG